MIEYTRKPFQTVKETATTTGFSQFFIRNGIKDGTIPYVRAGEKYLVNVPAFLALMDEQSKKGA
jgi:excisionase family DNA binding protein